MSAAATAITPDQAQPADLTLDSVRARMAANAACTRQIEELWRRYPVKRAILLQALWLAQQEFGWVPRAAIEWAAEVSAVSPAHAFGVVEFYTMYKQVPTGRHLIQVCQTMCCLLQGGENLIEHLERALGVRCGGTTHDGLFTLVRVECLALCGSGPGVMIDDQAIGPEPHALGGQGALREGHLEAANFHPGAQALDRWIAFLRQQAGPNPGPAPKQVHAALGELVVGTKGHPQGVGSSAKPLDGSYCPAAPALKLAANATGEAIALTWVNDPGCAKVVVERSDDQGASWREHAVLTARDQKASDKLPVGVTAHYRVICHEQARTAKPSAVVSAMGKPTPPPAPASVTTPAGKPA